MERILSLLLSLFSDAESLQKVFARLAERLLKDVPDVEGCKAYVLKHLEGGTLDDEFRRDPLCVILCLSDVILDVGRKLHPHDHDHDPDSPVIVVGVDDADYYQRLGTALKCPQVSEGPLGPALFFMILEALKELLKTYLDKE